MGEKEKKAQKVKNNLREARHRGKLRVHVQGVLVPRKAVKGRGVSRQTLLEGVVGRARGRGVGRRRRRGARRRRGRRSLPLVDSSLSAKPPSAAHKHRQLLVAQHGPLSMSAAVPGRRRQDDNGRLPLVADREDPRLGLNLCCGGEGAGDGDELLPVEDSHMRHGGRVLFPLV